MHVEKKRIFIGNLPLETNEVELKKKCAKYGEVLTVELKQRHDSSIFAFVDLNINPGNLNACFEALRQQEWKGHSVTVELARESFLSRLAREREEQQKHQQHTTTLAAASGGGLCQEEVPYKGGLPMFRGTKLAFVEHPSKGKKKEMVAATQDTEKVLAEQPVQGKKEVALKDDLLGRLTSFSDTWADDSCPSRGSLQGIAKQPLSLHEKQTNKLVSNNKTIDKTMEPERFILSEQRRLKSLDEKRRVFNEQKKVIQSALASVDNKQTLNKRVVFNSDDDSDADAQEPAGPPAAARTTLFDDDSADEQLTINHHFEGEKGRKLMELQSRYGNDERFRLDERFRDDDEDDNENERSGEQEDDERMQNLKILGSVLGREVLPADKNKHKHGSKPMLRFDPTKPEHVKYELKKDTTTANGLTKKKKIATELISQPSVKVSKEKFYKVSEALKESFQKKDGNESFSLRKMFGADDNEETENGDGEPSSKVDPQGNKKVGSQNPLRDAPGDQVKDGDGGDDSKKEVRNAPISAQQHVKRDVKLVQGNTFFFLPDDLRLSEGVEFFSKKSSSTKRSENFAEYRKDLKRWAKRKVKNNKVVVPKRKRNVKQGDGSQKRNAKKFRR